MNPQRFAEEIAKVKRLIGEQQEPKTRMLGRCAICGGSKPAKNLALCDGCRFRMNPPANPNEPF